jgi:DNA ligase-associated metallophosphoesterase
MTPAMPAPSFHPLSLSGAALRALPSGALHWPDQDLLVVSDLHLGKSERLARRGGSLLPPYETQETLAKLDADLESTGAARVVCLGDSFDDLQSADSLDDFTRLWLARLMAGRDWIWIEGNHDAGPVDVGGTHLAELAVGPLVLRHIARPGARAEVSGHYHPKARLAGRSRPCFLADDARLILPAFGHYTGGLYCEDAALQALMSPRAVAVMTGPRAIALPMPRR